MEQYLVVANQTLGGSHLKKLAVSLAEQETSRFHVVVPATPPSAGERAWMRSEHLVDRAGESAGVTLARWTLRAALADWTASGLDADGAVGDPDPLTACAEAIDHRPFDLIIVSTLPRRVSRWLALDIPGRIRRTFDLPVLHLEARTPTGTRGSRDRPGALH
jgi:hypothetical protein